MSPACLLRSITSREAPQQAELAVEQRSRLLGMDFPPPRLGDVERTANLRGAAMRDIKEPSRITTGASITFSEVMDNATRRPLDLICRVGAILPQLRNDRTQCANEIECNCVRYQHRLFSLCSSSSKGTPSRRLPPRLGSARRARSASRPVTSALTHRPRSEEHTSELQSLRHLVCRL